MFCAFTFIASAQISHGGRPLPLQADTRALMPDFFIEMPPFDVQEARMRSEQNRASHRSLEFAHKFHVFLRPDNSGITFTNGSMNVWRVGIHSQGAYSLNILFSRFRIPRGAKVFVYNADQTEILGSFTHLNNSDFNLLPIQPIFGDKLIVEYQEPINASFRGEIEIGEVNHDFFGIFRSVLGEPRDPNQSCHPNIICYPNLLQVGRGVLVLIINGTSFCTGVLVNNTEEDGTPFVLTATHCLNNDFSASFLQSRHYDVVASRIIAVFNYDSPVCSRDIRGQLQMSLASADVVLINEPHDISLLRLRDEPPREFQPFFLGWNVSPAPPPPFHGIHHPNAGTKRVAIANNNLVLTTWHHLWARPAGNAYWRINTWNVAATEGGSSGSPLLDRDLRIVGTLTGGSSYCPPRAQGPDFYAALSRAMDVHGLDTFSPNTLRHYLDPRGYGFMQLNGFNPFADTPIVRSQNFNANDIIEQTMHNNVSVFSTNNTFGYSALAEEFEAKEGTQIVGVFVSSAPTANVQNLNLHIRVYTGEEKPEMLVHSQPFIFNFQRFIGGTLQNVGRDMNRFVENFIQFNSPVTVSGRFFISVVDMNNVASGFSVLNVAPRGLASTEVSTAWVRKSSGWIRSNSEDMVSRINTSLMIVPYVIGEVIPPPNGGDNEVLMNAFHSRTEQMIFVESNHELAHWEVFYSNGQQMFRANAYSSRRLSMHTTHWARGVYIVRVRTVDGVSVVRKILVM